MTFREFINILEAHGFELDRQPGSHRVYKGVVVGRTRVVLVAGHQDGEEIKRGTLNSMIRQSGLPKRVFR
jgi:predicted RNA binding protein YcfA (HicA-like mRNA interferase family)